MKIHKDAQQVFKGILFSVYQWQQKMYDGSYETFEMISRKPSVDIIAVVGNKIIVLSQEQPTKPKFIGLPGGMIDPGESPKQAAQREFLEETGHAQYHLFLYKKWEGMHKIYYPEHLFIAQNCQKVGAQKLDPGEKIKVTFRTFDEFLELCRDERFMVPVKLRLIMYEALLDLKEKKALHATIFSNSK